VSVSALFHEYPICFGNTWEILIPQFQFKAKTTINVKAALGERCRVASAAERGFHHRLNFRQNYLRKK
jgi:hypothetical protein